VFFFLQYPFTIEFLLAECQSSKILILLQLKNSLQVWQSTRKVAICVSTSTDVLFPAPFLLPLHHHCGNRRLPNPPPPEPDDPKPAAYIKMEHCYEYLYRQFRNSNKNICKNFGKCSFCWVIRMLDNLVPVCSHG
jgi:hypothetical protein